MTRLAGDSTGRRGSRFGHPFGGLHDRDAVVVHGMAVHSEQRVGGGARDAAQVPDGNRQPYQGDQVRRALRILLEAAVAQRLGMPATPGRPVPDRRARAAAGGPRHRGEPGSAVPCGHD
ncbi:hypothetical protein [Streptomyces halobius]|uniref:Uncharacterized protein n=1 Tax=Streptomyces halobius TaxID=2879846 RepID=A0ABY4MAH0_9ACTN|nr:hypothetical protein [Streptomyces halobius]UQA94138.1 hypothetical protein K9S39_21685 [Streptomyces halobius]